MTSLVSVRLSHSTCVPLVTPRRTPKVWLFSVAPAVKLTVWVTHALTPPTDWGLPTPEDIIAGEELADCMRLTLSRLPDNQRAVLGLRDFDGEELGEIARLLDLSPANVRVLLHRARTRLFQTIERFQEPVLC